jgi:ABC-2 type transport system permease protein
VSEAFGTQVWVVARRSILRTLRQPFVLVPSLTFPLFLLAINAAGLDAATEIPGFPTDSYVSFVLAFAFVQGSMFAVTAAGTDIANDVETGFLNRLSLTPLRGPALITGTLAGAAALGLLQGVVFLSVGLAAGAEFESGVLGVPVLLALMLLNAMTFGAIGTFFALRTGKGEAVQGLFPLVFVFLFLSSVTLPRDLIEQHWFQTIATYNPVSYLVEGLRSLVITGWDGEALALGGGLALGIFALALTAARSALRTRLVRT